MTSLLPFRDDRRLTLREAAEQWIERHPIAMDLFRRFAGEMLTRNRRFGMKALGERVRWQHAIDGAEEFKINNNYLAYVARRLIRDDRRLQPLLEFRVTKAANRPLREPRTDPTVNPLDEEPDS